MLVTLISFAIMFFIVLSLSFIKPVEKISLLNRVHTSVLKGIGTILVLISHIGNNQGIAFFNPFGGLGVTVFLIITGYGLNESFKKNGLKNFLSRRLTSILIPYWLVVCFYWIFHYNSFELSRFIGSFILTNRLSLTWYVYYILGWYIAFYFIKKYLKNDYWFLIISLIIILITSENYIGEQAFSLTLGIYISEKTLWKNKLESRKNKIGITCFTLGIVFSAIFFYLKINGFDTPVNYLIFNVAQGIMKTGLALSIIIFTSNYQFFLYQGLSWVGKISFEVYLVHAQVLNLLRDNLTSLILFFSVVCVASIIIHLMSQKIKLFSWKQTAQ